MKGLAFQAHRHRPAAQIQEAARTAAWVNWNAPLRLPAGRQRVVWANVFVAVYKYAANHPDLQGLA